MMIHLLLALLAPQDLPSVEDQARQLPGETVVTARKRPETLNTVPGAVSVVTAEDIEQAGMRTVADAALLVPNLSMTEFSSRRLSFPYVRGVGAGTGEAAVVTYIDGVPQLTTGSTNLPLVGLDRVEILRGPQGALYGRNALGGVIKLESRRPSREPMVELGATLGEFDTQRFTAGYSGPLGHGGDGSGPFLDLTLLDSQRDGYTKNLATGNRVDDRDAFFGRASVLFQPSESSEVRVGLYGERSRDGGFVLSDLAGLRRNPHRINQNFEGVAERDVVAPFVNWRHYGDAVDFTSVTAYTDWDILETSDFDFSAFDAVRRTTIEEQEYIYQELRWSSAEDASLSVSDEVSMSWLAGVQGFSSDSERSAANDFRVPLPAVGVDTSAGEFDDYGLGVFGEATFSFDERFDLSAGLRYDYESKEADLRSTFVDPAGNVLSDVRTDSDDDFDQVLPSLAAALHTSEQTTVYARLAKGYRAGGINLRAPVGQLEFDPEENWSYEVGVKTTLSEERVDLRVAAFHIDWDDMQLNLFDATAGGYTDNAGESTSSGLELETTARVHENVTLYGGIGYSDTEFDEYTDPFGNDVSGEALPFVPETTFNLGLQLGGDIDEQMRWFARVDYIGVGDFYYDPDNTEQESYELVNLRAGLARKGWSLTLWARNLTDEEYFPVAFQPNPADPTAFIAETGEPMVAGVTLRTSF